MTMCQIIEEPCNGKLLSTVLKTNGVGDNLVEFTTVNKLKVSGLQVETGQFGAMMQVTIENDSPVTLLLEKEAI